VKRITFSRPEEGKLVFRLRVIKLNPKHWKAPQIFHNPEKERSDPMTLEICWLDDLAKAQEAARKTNKPILLDFFNPQ
jgi:hypothetical protein